MSQPATTWPRLRFETHEWPGRTPAGYDTSYEAAVTPRIAAEHPQLDPEVAARAHQAALAIHRFDADAAGEIAPFVSVLLRSESAASSHIENLTASARQIAEAELRAQAQAAVGAGGARGSREAAGPAAGVETRSDAEHELNARAVVANTRAMDAAIRLADRLDSGAILDMHAALLGELDPQIAGAWRNEQVWIGGGPFSPHGAMFTPPHADRVPWAIEDLLAFMARTDIPVMVQAALAHAQFETIHPFADGNGRTGRALIHALLRAKGLTTTLTVPISAGLLTDTRAYFQALEDYRAGDINPIVGLLADSAQRAIQNGQILVADLSRLRTDWSKRVTARQDAAAWRLADALLRQPVVDAAAVGRVLGIAARNAYRAIEPLAEAGVLVEFTDRLRGRMWRCDEVLDAVDEFAARAGRRVPPVRL